MLILVIFDVGIGEVFCNLALRSAPNNLNSPGVFPEVKDGALNRSSLGRCRIHTVARSSQGLIYLMS